MHNEPAIKVTNVSKTFRLPHEKNSSIKSAVVNFYKRNKSYETQTVLNDISFEVKKGEFLGIVGRNGSGKSTMLKMLAGIYAPSEGDIQVNGRLTPFIELGVGFNQELSGRENVYLNGALLGMDRAEMSRLYPDIVAFAELEKFMDQKLKNYSSGMQVRLAFSIAIRAKSDILLLDEVLAVGDAAFQRKCFEYFGELKRNKQTVVFISHDMASVRKYCDRAILIDRGDLKFEGKTEKIIDEYSKLFLQTDTSAPKTKKQTDVPLGMSPDGRIDRSKFKLSKPRLVSSDEKVIKVIDRSEAMLRVRFDVEALASVSDFIPGVIVQNAQGEFITATNGLWAEHSSTKPLRKGDKTTVAFDLPNIYEKGDYTISLNVVSTDLETFLDWKNAAIRTYIDKKFETGAKAYPKFDVRYQ